MASDGKLMSPPHKAERGHHYKLATGTSRRSVRAPVGSNLKIAELES